MSENKKHHLLCIVCPEGCEMDIEEKDGDLVFPKHVCRRGQDYARQEVYNPCRVLTTTVRIEGGDIAMLPVRTERAVPKKDLIKAMRRIASIVVHAPISVGDVVCNDVADGIPLIACRNIGKGQ